MGKNRVAPKVTAVTAAREAARRMHAAFSRGRERASLARLSNEPTHLKSEYAQLSASALLDYFRSRTPRFFSGFENRATAQVQRDRFPAATAELLHAADLISTANRSPSGQQAEWLRDPRSNRVWPLDYHADIAFGNNDGSDIRTLWELNRLNHFITLSRAYAVSGNEEYATTLLGQFDSWLHQNPLGRGPNWNCAMEVALRAMNLLAAFTLCRHAQCFTEVHLQRWLQSLEQHGGHIKRNLEFSHLGTTNHYLTDVVGLLWLGLVLPELFVSDEWRAWALQELLSELDKQVLPDGAIYEGTTGYHRYVLELLLYSFILCRQHGIEIGRRYWDKLKAMLIFLQHYVRPDSRAPLIGDTDGSQVLPVISRRADDHGYLLSIGAVALSKPSLKSKPATEEILWLFGEAGLVKYDALSTENHSESRGFAAAGVYVMRRDDLFLLFNAARHLRAGRSSHRHNDALSIEVSVCGRAFIVDPGTYIYSADLAARHAFRSTAYHSTIQIDDEEQNTITESQPFLFGNNAKPMVTHWESNESLDRVTGVHVGYERLPGRVRHERSITFYKHERWWLIEDQLTGRGTHKITSRFHLADGLETTESKGSVTALATESGARLLIIAFDGEHSPDFESQFVSREYGSRIASTTVSWTSYLNLPCSLRWALLPVCSGEDEQERRLAVARELAQIVN